MARATAGGAAAAGPRRVLVPGRPQELWRWPAALNFAAGGLGAGWYVVALAAAGLERTPAVTAASVGGPLLVLAGFAAVAGEAGRPRRGPRVLARLRSSWMSRELVLGLAFVLLAPADLLVPRRWHRVLAAVLALLLALAQGAILRQARGVPAWSVPGMPLLFLLSALLAGTGAVLAIGAAAGGPPAAALPGAAVLLGAATALAWWPVVAGADPAGPGRPVAVILAGGHGLPVLLVLVAAAVPAAAPALVPAGALLVAGQVAAKAWLILAAGRLHPITLHLAPAGGRAS